ncbi:hypothetical protein [Rothia kristinae]|uniref:hypothetical protein n=1 Tax=Rothia kristinae TaxID=37923 RepID=UPI001E5548D9
MTGFLAEGGLRRHTARMRREYRRRRDLLARVLAPDRLPPGVRVLPMDGGLHTVVELPDGQGTAGERRLVDAAARQEVGGRRADGVLEPTPGRGPGSSSASAG